MRCEGCGASVFEGDVACGECGRELPAAPTPPEAAPTVEPKVVEDTPAPPPADGPRCAEHPDALSVATCARCGRFCCVRCVPEPGKTAVCPACHRRVRTDANPAERRRIRLEVKVSFFFAAFIALVFGVGLPLVFSGGRMTLSWLVLGGGVTAVLALCAVLFALTERAPFAWVAVAFELLGALGVFLVLSGSCWSWPLLAFPVVTAMRLNRWRVLEAEAGELAAPPDEVRQT